jgi:hypothetical protein
MTADGAEPVLEATDVAPVAARGRYRPATAVARSVFSHSRWSSP